MKKKFIIISEFNDVYFHVGELPQEVLDAVNDGIDSVIDISDSDKPKQYSLGNWCEIELLMK